MSNGEIKSEQEPPYDLTIKYVFIDTTSYFSSGFDVDSAVFSALRKLLIKDEIRLLITDIIRREVHSGISELSQEACNVLRGKGEKLRIISAAAIPGSNAIMGLTEGEISASAVARWNSYWNECSAVELDISTISIPTILDKYFSRQPPFASGKKKHEFPDAINIEAIRRFSVDHESKVYLVSDDPDIISCCDENGPLVHAKSLGVLVAAHAKTSQTQKIAHAISKNSDAIFERLIDIVDHKLFKFDAPNYDVVYSDISDPTVKSINVLQENGHDFSAEMELNCLVSAQIEHRDWISDLSSSDGQGDDSVVVSDIEKRIDLWAEISGTWLAFEDEVHISLVAHSSPQIINLTPARSRIDASTGVVQDLPTSEPSRFQVGDRAFHRKFGPGTVRGIAPSTDPDRTILTIYFDQSGQKKVIDSFVQKTEDRQTAQIGDRIFHQKFGYGQVKGVDGNKLTVAFDKAGEKKVIDSFVEKG